MKLTIIPPIGSPIEITGTLVAEGPDDVQITRQTPIDVSQPINAEQCTVAPDQRPPVATLSLKIAKEHATPGQAEFYLLSHLDELPAGGKVRLECEEPNGFFVGRLRMDSAGLSAVQGTYTGCTTIVSYTFTGSVPTIRSAGTPGSGSSSVAVGV